MRKIILAMAFFLIFISGCSLLPFSKSGIQEGSVSGKRGVIMQFLADQPPKAVQENENFFLGLKIDNYLPAATPVQLEIVPSLQIPGQSQRIDQSFMVQMDAAVAEDDKVLHAGGIQSPQDKLDAGGNLHLGPYSYTLPYSDEEVQFFAEYSYPVEAMIKGRVCSADPSLASRPSCPGERLSESSFEGPARVLPITVSKVEKKPQSFSRNTYQLALDFYLEDKGSGNITTNIIFMPEIEGKIPMKCKQDPLYGTDPTGFSIREFATGYAVAPATGAMQVQLKDGKAKVHCTSDLPSREQEGNNSGGSGKAGSRLDAAGEILDRELSMSLAYVYRVQLRSQKMNIVNVDE